MPEPLKLNRPWLVAAWPGMGAVALNAAVYLLAKLRMRLVAEFEANDLFDIEHVEVKDGIIQSGRRPANRFFLWTDPAEQHDLVIFLGEAQPPLGKYPFCRQLMAYARQHGVERQIVGHLHRGDGFRRRLGRLDGLLRFDVLGLRRLGHHRQPQQSGRQAAPQGVPARTAWQATA